MLRLPLALLLAFLSSSSTVYAQFSCTFSGAKDESSCVKATEKNGSDHCVWCDVGGSATTTAFGFCVSETQAETIEESIPSAHCDRYNDDGDDDTKPPTDDDDDYNMPDDDQAPSDDAIPSDYWECLKNPDEKSCGKAKGDCTWCDTPAGYGVCMAGPSAEAAKDSAWFTCKETSTSRGEVATSVQDPMDPSCLVAYLQDPSPEGCAAAVDADGNPCEFCTLQGAFQACLNEEQAEIGEQFGVTCDAGATTASAVEDPMDPSCLVAFLQDQSEEGCTAAVDADGNACEFCTLQGAYSLCLNEEQAAMGEPFGLECAETATTAAVEDPMDPSCLVAFLQDQSEEGCTAAVDADGNACEFCTLQGAYSLCLNEEQAAMGEPFGLECAETTTTAAVVKDPMDPSCLVAFLQDQSPEGCAAAVDADGNPCEFCTLQGAFQVCLNEEQAAMGEQFGVTCEETTTALASASVEDPMDPSCLVAFLQDQSEEGCEAAMDADGNPCEFCTLQGAFQLCLNEEQAAMGEQFGLDCDGKASAVAETSSTSPFDELSECLEHYEEDDCFHSSCTWCNTQVGMGFCLTPGFAEVTKEWSFFDCEFSKHSNEGPVLLTATA